jgi:uncharacterized membrane protein YhhN
MMTQISKMNGGLTKKSAVDTLTVLYFAIAAVEIIAEYFKNYTFIYGTKPLIIPILALLYIRKSKSVNYFYLAALFFSWAANIFFVSQDFQFIVVGAVLFFIYRSLAIYVILKHIKLPSLFPTIVGCVPFVFIYMYLVNLTYDTIGHGLVIFIIQCVLISFLGGISVGNYVLRSNKANTLLLISTLFFAVTQFIFVIRLYYVSINIFQPLAMLLFTMAQYLYYKFLILAEKKKAGYKVKSNSRR